MNERIDRRTFVAGAAAAAVAGALGGPTAAALATSRRRIGADGLFRQSVASGEPATNAITLWTRLEEVARPETIGYEIARDPGFAQVVHRGTERAHPDNDFTVHPRVKGRFLAPGEQYYYRFHTTKQSSPVGRFHTARPVGSAEPTRIAFFSCQEFIAGYYAAHRDLAVQDVDLVVCLGDYVYEQAFADTGSRNSPVRQDDSVPDGETQTLDEYRRKYGLHHTDPDLLEMRRLHPFMAIWDDHEVEDNYADGLPGGAARNRRVTFAQRKANGYQAFFEHMPRRIDRRRRIYGSIGLGAAELFLLDTRQYRDDQPCNPEDQFVSQPCPPSVTDDPSRTLLGAEQKRWLKDGLRRSRAPWKVIANQVMITSVDAPPRNPINTDSWDGYGAERRELIEHIARSVRGDVTFVTGDIHTFFAGDVTRSGRQAVCGVDVDDPLDGAPRATEFVGGSVTSPGIVDRLATTEAERNAAAVALDAFVLGNNPQITYSNQPYKGYGLLEATGGELKVQYRAVREHRSRDSDVFTLRRFRVVAGRPVVIDEDGPVPLPEPGLPGPLPDGLVPTTSALGASQAR